MAGFFDILLDVTDPRTARARHAQHDATQALADGEQLAARQAQLEQTVAQQRRQLETLGSVVGVLATVLRDTGVVDAAVLDYRLEAALEEAQMDQAAATADVDGKVTCTMCGLRLPPSQTLMTEFGVRCDRCGG